MDSKKFKKMGKQLFYLVNQRLPTEKAYGLQISKTCEALAQKGIEVKLVYPFRINPVKEDLFSYYGVKKNFRIKKIPAIDFYLPGKSDKLSFFIKSFISAVFVTFYAIFYRADFIYSRDELPLYFLSFFKKNIFFEAHRFSKSRAVIRFYRRFKELNLKIIVITNNLKNEFVKFGFGPENILVAPDAVDLEEFDIDVSKEEVRKKLNLPPDKILIGYVGQLRTMGMKKGVDFAIESIKFLPKDCTLVLVGGIKKDIDYYKKLSEKENLNERILFVGRIKHNLIPVYLKAFDILIMPFPNIQHYAFYMSPLKLFEYMASKRPIVATDLPTVREVLNEENSVLVKSENLSGFVAGIKKILENSDLAEKISRNAFKDVQNYTWQKRAEKILEFIINKI